MDIILQALNPSSVLFVSSRQGAVDLQVGGDERGHLLELMLAKLRYWEESRSGREIGSQGSNLQIIGMSATLPNLDQVAAWLNAAWYRTTVRPVELRMYLALVDANSKYQHLVGLSLSTLHIILCT